MHTHKFLRTLPRSLLSAAVVAGIVTAAGVFAVDGTPPGLFELEGDTLDVGGTPGADWSNIFLGTNTGNPVASTGILNDEAAVTIFTQGTKDIGDLDTWTHTNGNVPDKNEITNAYAAGYINPTKAGPHEAGDLIIYFGLDRYANNGDAFAGFWFYQQDIGLNDDGSFEGLHTARQGLEGQPGYVPGDLLVLVEYPQGANAQPEVKVYEWDPADADNDNVATNLDQIYSSANAKCDGAGNKLACAITNINNLTNEPLWDYTPKSGSASDLPKESFFEGGINVTRLLGGATPCFSSFLAETRSSRSETAELKDFVLGNFDLCSIAVTKRCEADVSTSDGGNSIVVSFSGNVTNDGGLALDNVTVTDDNGTPGNPADDVPIPIGTLQPGETKPYSGSYNTTAIPATDRVTATGSRGSATVEATADASCSPQITRVIDVSKRCTATLKSDGSGVDVSFDGVVTNNGNVALKDVIVMDDNGTPLNTADDKKVLGPVTLNAGASMNYTGGFGVTGTNTSTDVVTASGKDVLTDTAVSDTASATCLADTNPVITLTKRCEAEVNDSGDGIDVTFTGTVKNDGNVILNNVTVVDDNGTPGNTGDDKTLISNATLAVGASLPFSGSFSSSGSSSTDVVTATAKDGLTGNVVSDNESASCTAIVNPAILVTKQCTAVVNTAGTAIVVSFNGRVTNTGNVALENVDVVDDNGTPGNTADDVPVLSNATLAPGAWMDFSGSFTTSSSPSTDVVTATGDDVLKGQAVSDTADATCLADVEPSIAVTKQCIDATAFDQPILFNGTVTNTGNVALLGVTVLDDNGTPGDTSDDVPFNLGDLAPGASANYNGSYSPGPGTWTNTVVASSSDAIQSGAYTATASATCDVPPPPPEFEGCTPGFWKNSTGSWEDYSPSQKVNTVFTVPAKFATLGGRTLLQALSFQGGSTLNGAAQILLRAAVASLLNSTHSEVDSFPLSTAEVISQVNAALATKDRGTILALASTLDGYNNAGCDLSNDNSF